MRKKFEGRCDEFRKQIEDYKKGNDIIDELKKAHAKELQAHVQEHNKKYNDLLKEKMNMEDAMQAKADADLKALRNELDKKLKEAVEKARGEEKDKAKVDILKIKNDYND
jgi:hypothetical protein